MSLLEYFQNKCTVNVDGVIQSHCFFRKELFVFWLGFLLLYFQAVCSFKKLVKNTVLWGSFHQAWY